MTLSRRLFLKIHASLLFLGVAKFAQAGISGVAQHVSLKDFLTLSSRLTHFPMNALDPDVARVVLRAYRERGLSLVLSKLCVDPSSDEELAGEIILVWYSGICKTSKGSTIVAYETALLWKLNPFLHAPATCGGNTNYWSKAPEDMHG